MGRKGADRTARQKAADAKRSREMKGRRPKGLGGRGRRSSRSSSRSSSPRRTSFSGAVRRAHKKATVKGVAKGVAVVVALVVGAKNIKENWDAITVNRPQDNLLDQAVFSISGVRKVSNVLKLEWPEGVDMKAAGNVAAPATLFIGGPKVIDKIAAKLPADIKRMRIPLIGMPIATA